MGELHIDPVPAAERVAGLRDAQLNWANHLNSNRPNVPVAAFGTGLQAKAQQFLDLVDQGHNVRVNHAHRLAQAGEDISGLVDRVGQAEQENSASLNARGGWA
ncbi:hypothetical protein [Corynebacterium jeikeium]|uniref:hypothetical protein n=1 Tax=Corynebacterium jeikeium TaxID=38289 RepID=UPI00055296B1|nr:hypothetical protein [Corynebacterium jeikeium]